MSYQPYNRNAKSLVYFGDAGADALFQSRSDLKFDDGGNGKLIIPDGGYIGSVGDDDAIQIGASGNVTFSQDIIVQGDFTVNGTTTTVNTTNLVVTDSLIELSNGATSATNDAGFIVERGSSGDNAAFVWDESLGRFTLGTTTATGASNGNLTITTGSLAANIVGSVTGNVTGDVTGDLTGNADTATTATTATTANNLAGSFITGLTDLGSSIDGTNDLLLVYDASATAYKSISRDDLVTGLGTMSQFTLAGDTGTSTITQGNTLTVAGGAGLTSSAASDTVTVAVGAGTGITVNANDIAVNYDDSTIGISSNNLFVKDGGITFAKLAGTAIQTSSEISASFQDNDTSLLTAAAIEDRILSKGYSTTTGTVTSVGGTGSVNGITLTGTVTSTGSLTLGGTLGNITLSQLAGSSVITSAESFSDDDDTLMTSAAIDDRILSYGYSTTTGTVTSVATAGTVNGLTLTGGTITGAGTITLGGTLSNVAVSNMAASAIQTGTEVGATGGSIGDNDTSLLTAAAIINFVEGKGYSTTTGTVTSVATTGSVNGITLTGGTITSAGTITLGGTLSNIANSQLTNSAITIAGVSTSLGGSITANTIAGAISAGTITNAQLANDSVSFGGVSLDLGQSDATPAFNLTDATNYKFGSLTRVINSSAITSDGTVSNDISIVDSTSGAVTMTLPTPANGLFYTIKKVDSSSNAVIVDAGTGSATLDGGANFTLYHQYETVSCVCDGTNWHIV